MRKFQEMCQEEFGKIELMARGGQKIVFDGVHNSYGETVIKLYFPWFQKYMKRGS